jgi:hypothetical protein
MNNPSIPSMHAEEKLPIFLINTLLLYIPLLALTDRQNYRQRNKYTRCAWAGGTFSSCAVVSVLGCGRNSFGCYLPTISVEPLCLFLVVAEYRFVLHR